jgi:hypothetical protein
VGGGLSPVASGNAGSGAHAFTGGLPYGLARMAYTGDTTFEMKAIRSLGPTQLEIEFTEPVVSVATSNFVVRQGVSVQDATQGYGNGYNAGTSTLTVSAVTLNLDKTRATLTITGLQQRPATTTPGSTQDRTWGSLVQINVTGVVAVSNRTMWGTGTGGGVAWYTLNKFGPGADIGAVIATCHQCGSAADTHRNCANEACHLLFIQCPACQEKYAGCCSVDCVDFTRLTQEEQLHERKGRVFNGTHFSKCRPGMLNKE